MLAESLGKPFLGSLVGREVDGADVSLAAMHRGHFYLDGTWGDGLDVVCKQPGDFFVLLMRNEPTGHLGIGFRGKDGLRPFACVATPDAADVKRRTAAVAFQGGVAFFALQLVDADGGLVTFLVKRYLGDHATFGVGHLLHSVIEVGDGDASVGIDHLREHGTEHVDGIGNGSTEVSRVKVSVRSSDLDFPVGKSAQSGGERGQVSAQHAGIRHKDDVRLQQFLVLLQEGIQTRRAYLLLPFEDELHVVFQRSLAHHVLERLHLDERLSLVIVGTACEEVSVTDFRFERLALPELQWFGRHDVIVGIDEHGGCVG